jgi:hypothetical protein
MLVSMLRQRVFIVVGSQGRFCREEAWMASVERKRC